MFSYRDLLSSIFNLLCYPNNIKYSSYATKRMSPIDTKSKYKIITVSQK